MAPALKNRAFRDIMSCILYVVTDISEDFDVPIIWIQEVPKDQNMEN
jgi:hypothetical protein